MRALVVFVTFAALAVAAEKQWFEGGTLHKKTGRDWLSAAPENRPATAADFSSSVKKPKSLAEMRANAVELEKCITGALQKPKDVATKKWAVYLDLPVTEIAGPCVTLLKQSTK